MKGKLFFGTQTGTTEAVAEQIQKELADLVGECRNIYGVKKEELEDADFLVLGGSTWGDGELTDDFQDSLHILEAANLSGKTVALFALGDQYGYGYNFVSAMKIVYDTVKKCGAREIGSGVSRAGIDFEHSESLQDDAFLGLVLDEVNQPEMTEKRIKEWVSTVRQELAQADLTSVG